MDIFISDVFVPVKSDRIERSLHRSKCLKHLSREKTIHHHHHHHHHLFFSNNIWVQLYKGLIDSARVVSRFLSRRFHPKSMRLFPFYFSNITLRTDLQTFGVTDAVIKIAGEMRRLPAYFDNPAVLSTLYVYHYLMDKIC